MLSADNYVHTAFGTQGVNRYSYTANNPLKYTDPSGEIAWFIPVTAGAFIGAAVGGYAHSNTFDLTKWSQDSWKAATIGGIIGAGIGLGISYGLAAGGVNITLISAVGLTKAAGLTGAHTAGWNITANSLLTANGNLLSSYAQGRNFDGIYQSGLIGLGAGALGGGAGHLASPALRFVMSANAVKIQNYVTAGLNGFGDRMSISYQRGDRGSALWRNAFKGMGEGLLSANLVNNNFIFNSTSAIIETGTNVGNLTITGQYLSSFLTQTLTSVPGAGYTAYTYYAMYGTAMVLGDQRVLGRGVGYGITGVLHPVFPSITNWWMGEDYPALIRPYGLW